MNNFDFQLRTRILFGPNKVDQLGELASELGGRRALVVSDPGVVSAGHAERGLAALRRAGIEVHLFDGLRENPTTDQVEAGLAIAHRYDPEILIGLGGGSSLDCAKGINFLYTNGGKMHDYWGVGKALRPMLPMIAVPTTAGTGSETQSFALISDAKTHVKMACGDKKATCRIAILDPTLTVTQPPRVTALTGIDAISHALETYVTKPRNPMSLLFSREAWSLLAVHFPRVLANPHDLESRMAMQLGACYAGVAIENSMLGAAHALANPLTAHHGLAHGEAIGVMLPHVLRFNAESHGDLYTDLVRAVAGQVPALSIHSAPEDLASYVAELVQAAGLTSSLASRSIDRAHLPQLAIEAAKQWTGTFNPRPVDADKFAMLYERAY